METVELQSKRAAERQPDDMWLFEIERVDEASQAMTVVGHAE
jgi:hypothetical protein